MARRIPARLSAAAGRKFGLTLGIAFLVIGGLLLWRGKPVRADVGFALGVVLVSAALIAPTALGPAERAWMGLAHLMSKVTTPIFMGVVYFLVMTPIGLLRRAFGGSQLRRRADQTSFWYEHKPPADLRESMERQF
jgi:hypothetical protein